MRTLGLNAQQLQKMQTQPGFIAALDQSGGSTPNALRRYGIKEGAWANEEEMFALVHQMRTRLMTSPSFTGERILAAILFENTMDRDIEGQPTANYLWHVKRRDWGYGHTCRETCSFHSRGGLRPFGPAGGRDGAGRGRSHPHR